MNNTDVEPQPFKPYQGRGKVGAPNGKTARRKRLLAMSPEERKAYRKKQRDAQRASRKSK